MSPTPAALGLSARIARWVVGHRRLALASVVVTTLLAVFSATRVGVSFSSRDFFASSGTGADAVAALDALTDRWGPDDATVLVVAEAEHDVREPAKNAALSELAAALRGLPHVVSVTSLVDLAALPGGAAALGSYPVVPALIAEDGRATVVVVRLDQGSDDLAAVLAPVAEVREVVAGFSGAGGLSLSMGGVPATRAAFFELAIGDQLLLGPLVALVVASVLWIAFRRVHAVVIPMLAAGLPLVWLLGLMAAASEPIGLLNQAYFTLLPVIAVADAVHWVCRVHEERDHDQDPSAAVVAAARGVGRACALTSLTTAAGFLSLMLVDVSMLRRFGGWAAIGIGLSWLSILVVVPLALSVVSTRGRVATHRFARRVAEWSLRRRAVVVLLGVVMIGAAGASSAALPVDNRLGELLPPDHPVQRASATIDARLGGILSLDVELAGEGATPEAAQAFVSWARGLPSVRWVGEADAGGAATRTRDGFTRIRLHTADIGGQAFAELAADVRARASGIADARAIVSGTSLVAYTGVNTIADRLRTGLVALIFVVTGVIAVALRSWRLAIVAVPVNIAPLMAGGAILGLLGLTLDPLAAVIVAVALGIAVDDTLHLMARVAEERRDDRSEDDAIAAAAEHSGRAIVVTTLALAGGLSMQLLASFPPLKLLGGIGAAILLVALAVDLTLLPALLSWLGRGRAR